MLVWMCSAHVNQRSSKNCIIPLGVGAARGDYSGLGFITQTMWVSEWVRIPENAKYANVRVWHSSCPAEAMLQDVRRVEIIVN